ncbi:uncharacterized protein L3040_002578 [Drepanopeziza brunnea f. sp. 'multigermtubi']|uniref:Peptidase A1 domain-containing protein n=1 Tax=Marssonina brunnea f. sp. multigermtubi (strain MB_m1) TaxID=1072389 RepID=K1X3E0_MARBU|nr:uncharacterized protein MBM_02779 [Drepanopeziza brunnea f. sp. 'multigermtubi' MB_m1]EKD19542.1 hypothetical protein MBM_02779 [Drepanopeziza brunnea f. sp. 'multigermtubi' MB_m1]KAJ5050703.1 hypothetical protein L3040_002578 [Drepanopeziza brunnea f. sp. 'multigermtubi']
MKYQPVPAITALVGVASFAAVSGRETGAYVYVPTEWRYGANTKITANITVGTGAVKPDIEVVMDTGSTGFWLWEAGAVVNWGSEFLFTPGPCNQTVPLSISYNISESPSGVLTDRSSQFGYSGSKLLNGQHFANDTLVFQGGNTTANVQFSLINYMSDRTRIQNGVCDGITYDESILGLAPGSPFRANLYETGKTASRIMSMWIDKYTGPLGTLTGGMLFGALDKSKYTAPLVRVQNYQQAAFYVPRPRVSFNGVETPVAYNGSCLIDTGTHSDTIPIASFSAEETSFYNTSNGLLLMDEGGVAYNGSCDSIPLDLHMDYTFDAVAPGEYITISVPLRNYARGAHTDTANVCPLVLYTGGNTVDSCTFGAPFFTAAFAAFDEADNSIYLAKGAVSKPGSGVDFDRLKVFGVGDTITTTPSKMADFFFHLPK